MSIYYLNVPFAEKDYAKALGAKWDYKIKKWYYENIEDKIKFKRWAISDNENNLLNDNIEDFIPKKHLITKTLDDLSDEQKNFVNLALSGKNILVDACIGSGKTTSIQVLCNEFKGKKILYLTYNKLLKLDAQDKIHQKGVLVTNYHGFAYKMLKKKGITVGISDQIQTFINVKPKIPHYDVLIIDEYQDINQELSELLNIIKDQNPGIQIIAVGDMDQKIYDWTTLNVKAFIQRFLDDYIQLSFTYCFRLSAKYAEKLGFLWGKQIRGANTDCSIEDMPEHKVIEFLSKQDPKDVLCLGRRNGHMVKVLNDLETYYPKKYNKFTTYASIRENDGGQVSPDSNAAIFTTFDGSKGMERKICVIFDYTEENWTWRVGQDDTDDKILRNIFLVAASRGKNKIIFAKDYESQSLKSSTLLKVGQNKKEKGYNKPFPISGMFDFKYKEDIEDCFKMINIKRIKTDDTSVINIESKDGLIDLSPCIGNYQSAVFFNEYDIDEMIEYAKSISKNDFGNYLKYKLNHKILYLTAIETGQNRYIKQVKSGFIKKKDSQKIIDRLSTEFSGKEMVEGLVDYEFEHNGNYYKFEGRYDVLKHNRIYELKFVTALKHEHFLQLACYLVAAGIETGILWNTRNNEKYEVSVSDKDAFIKQVFKTITKGYIS